MNKYGIIKEDKDDFCKDCGEQLTLMHGKLVCLECTQLAEHGREVQVKIPQGRRKLRD